MDSFQPQQPDEGYSEDPLSGSGTLTVAKADDAGGVGDSQLPLVLTRHVSSLSVAARIRMCCLQAHSLRINSY